MASTKEYLAFILDQLSGLEEVTYKAMMGEFIKQPEKNYSRSFQSTNYRAHGRLD